MNVAYKISSPPNPPPPCFPTLKNSCARRRVLVHAKTTFVFLIVHVVGVEHSEVAGILGGPAISQGKELKQLSR